MTLSQVSLIHDMTRRVNVTTDSHSDFLILCKSDFDGLLKDFLKSEFEVLTSAIELFSCYFSSWTENSIRECCLGGRLSTYPADIIVMGDKVGPQEEAFFVISGSCRMIQYVQVEANFRYKPEIYHWQRILIFMFPLP